MRTIKYFIIHCSATEAGKPFTIGDIDLWHRRRGFRSVGYHYVITIDGRVQVGRDVTELGAHCLGHNHDSIGICYVGGLRGGQPCDTRTPEQQRAMRGLLQALHTQFPEAKVVGHRDLNPQKACPCFDARALNSLL